MLNVLTKINQRLGLLRRIKSLLPCSGRIVFFNSLILLKFDYANIVGAIRTMLYS